MPFYTMIISCPACGTRYAVPETAIGSEGRTVRCAKCKHSWFQDPEPLELGKEAVPQSPITAPATGPTTAPTRPPAPTTPPSPAPAPPSVAGSAPQEAAANPSAEPVASEEPTSQDAPGPSVDHWRSQPAGTEDDSYAAPKEPETAPEPVADPLADAQQDDDPYFDDVDNAFGADDAEDEYEGEGSSFDYRPPFTRRRNSLKMWTLAAAVFAALATGTVVAANYFGLPDWVPIERPEFGIGKTDLELDFPATQQRKEVLESGEEIFQVRGSISNVGQETVGVPSLLIVFRDAREKNVYSWVVVPSKRELAPGESLNVTEAITDIPPTAQAAEIGWSPS